MRPKIISGQINLTTGCIADAHVRFTGIRQMAPVCTPPNTCFLGPIRVQIPNGISVGSTVFARLKEEHPYTSQWATLPPSKWPFCGYLDPILHMIPWAHPSPQPKRHLDRFSHFAGLTTVTDRQTDRDARSVTTGRIYVRSTAMRPNNATFL